MRRADKRACDDATRNPSGLRTPERTAIGAAPKGYAQSGAHLRPTRSTVARDTCEPLRNKTERRRGSQRGWSAAGQRKAAASTKAGPPEAPEQLPTTAAVQTTPRWKPRNWFGEGPLGRRTRSSFVQRPSRLSPEHHPGGGRRARRRSAPSPATQPPPAAARRRSLRQHSCSSLHAQMTTKPAGRNACSGYRIGWNAYTGPLCTWRSLHGSFSATPRMFLSRTCHFLPVAPLVYC